MPKNKSRDVRPPNPPWIPLQPRGGNRVALSYYYGDSRSKIPVREVSHKNNPKADPNFETLTFGLFSTCDKPMRATIVKEGISLHFFCTKRGGMRVLTGYYQIGWYYKFPCTANDYALAAKKARFVSPGFPLRDLPPYLRGFPIDKWFRTFKYIDGKTANLLLQLINGTPNATPEYLREIRHLEKLSLKRDGYLYRRKYPHGFSWKVALQPMKLVP